MTETEKFELPWPITVIDFEASSFDEGSYPIEVGVGIWHGPRNPIHLWSSLIRPVQTWTLTGHWSRKSERVHGISRPELAEGRPPSEVACILNSRVSTRVAWCDGGPYDAYWLRTLYAAAGCTPSFHLMDWGALSIGRPELSERLFAFLERTPAPHRARNDALRLLQALASAIRVDASVEHLDDEQ